MKRREMRRKRERESIPPVLAALVARVDPPGDPSAPLRSLEPFVTLHSVAGASVPVLEGDGLARLCAALGDACSGPYDLLAVTRRVPRSSSTAARIDATELCFAIAQAIVPINVHERRRDAGRDAAPLDEGAPLIAYYAGDRFAALVGLPLGGAGAGEEWRRFLTALAAPLPMTLRVHRAEPALRRVAGASLQQDEEVRAVLAHIDGSLPADAEVYGCSNSAYHATPRIEYICRTLHAASAVSFQEVVSALPVLAAGIEPHHAVLDMCAAPGSKTLQALDEMFRHGWASAAKGVMIANEKDRVKATQTLPARLKRYHAPNTICTRCDAVQWPRLFQPQKDFTEHIPEWRFDRVICDVPCSGDGTLRKERTLASSWSPAYVSSLVATQRALLRRGLDLLREGGILVYSTCSLNPKEDEEVVCSALELFNDAVELLDVNEILRGRGATLHSSGGLISPSTEGLKAGVLPSSYDGRKVLRVLPHRDDTGGFFIAAFRKKSLPDSAPPAALHEKLNQWTKGKLWAAVGRNDETWCTIADFYGFDRNNANAFCYYAPEDEDGEMASSLLTTSTEELSGLVPVYHLNPHGGPCRRIVLLTPPAARTLFEIKPYKGPGVEIVSAGVRAFEAYDGKFLAEAPCRWRAVVESASYLAPFMRERKMVLDAAQHPELVKELLVNGFVWLREHWRVLLRQASPQGTAEAFVRDGALRDALTATECTEPPASSIVEMLSTSVNVGGVFLGFLGGSLGGEKDPWWLSATLSYTKLELAVDGSLRTFGLLALFGEESTVTVPQEN